jgi:hypothetical protein
MYLLLMVVNVVMTTLESLNLLIGGRHLSWLIIQWITLSLFIGCQVVIYACQNLSSSILALLLEWSTCVSQDYNNNNPWFPSCELLKFNFMFWVEFCSFFNQNMHIYVMLPKIHTLLKSSFFAMSCWCGVILKVVHVGDQFFK